MPFKIGLALIVVFFFFQLSKDSSITKGSYKNKFSIRLEKKLSEVLTGLTRRGHISIQRAVTSNIQKM